MPRLALIAMAAGLLGIAGCGGGGSPGIVNNGGVGGGGGNTPNSQAVSVNLGPTGQYVNGIFTSLTVCVPGTATCQDIPNVLVDTGSSGLRLLASGAAGGALTLALPQGNASNGNPLVECAQFADGFTWGPVKMANIKLAGETASSVPIQVIDASTYTVPASCSNTGPAENTMSTLLTNGILGVGVFRQDCGSGCTAPGLHFYFACSSPSSCPEVGATLTQQAQNPVWMFSSDNNGVVIQLPQVAASGAPSVSGTLTFGIGTQSDNALGNAMVLTTAPDGTLSTTFGPTTYTETFIDSGSNGYFFLTSGLTGLPLCPDGSGFYCPGTTQNLVATNHGANGAASVVNFSVANEQTLFSQPNAALNDLGGDNTPPPAFDWGLPFFFGRTVFTGIEGQNTAGVGPGPYLAY